MHEKPFECIRLLLFFAMRKPGILEVNMKDFFQLIQLSVKSINFFIPQN